MRQETNRGRWTTRSRESLRNPKSKIDTRFWNSYGFSIMRWVCLHGKHWLRTQPFRTSQKRFGAYLLLQVQVVSYYYHGGYSPPTIKYVILILPMRVLNLSQAYSSLSSSIIFSHFIINEVTFQVVNDDDDSVHIISLHISWSHKWLVSHPHFTIKVNLIMQKAWQRHRHLL